MYTHSVKIWSVWFVRIQRSNVRFVRFSQGRYKIKNEDIHRVTILYSIKVYTTMTI